ncbi:MAG: hypothetical protein ACYC7D_03830 [Nitrososphaerales archaeon]
MPKCTWSGSKLVIISLDLLTRVVELVASVGLIASCALLYRFFRGGIMAQSFMIFSVASVLFFIGRVFSTMIAFNYLPDDPFDEMHLILEIAFVLLLLGGLVLLYRKWTVQHRIPETRSYLLQ